MSKKQARIEDEDEDEEIDSEEGEKLFNKPIKQINDEGNPYWELSDKKRVTVNTFKRKIYINIREYYEKDGKLLPGSKGIALNEQMWQNLKRVQKDIDEAIAEQNNPQPTKKIKKK